MKDDVKRYADFVVCVCNADYPASLEMHKIYRVVPDAGAAADGDIRVVDESGEDYLYRASYFIPIAVPPLVKKSLRKAESAGANRRPALPLVAGRPFGRAVKTSRLTPLPLNDALRP